MSRTGILIKEKREKLDMTQDQLASKLGCSSVFISRVENGSNGTLIPLEKFYSCIRILKLNRASSIKLLRQDYLERMKL